MWISTIQKGLNRQFSRLCFAKAGQQHRDLFHLLTKLLSEGYTMSKTLPIGVP
jgi:hypothetical protein